MKLNGSSLFYSLTISILIAMITCSVLVAEQFNRLQIQRHVVDEELVRNAESGIALLCASGEEDFTGGKDIDLFGRKKDSVFLQRKIWGAYDVCISRARSRNKFLEQIALTGSLPDPEKAFALWLADMDRPLSVTGATELRGTCYLPKSGVERAYIEGHGYSGRQLVYGITIPSSRFMPKYNVTRVKEIEALFSDAPHEHDSTISWSEFQVHDSVDCSFGGKALIVSENQAVRIHDQYLRGQVCIISSVSIYVGKNSELENVILVAPRIEIEEQTEGQFQAFARDSLIVGKKVTLHYPSVLAVCAGKKSPELAGMIIGEGTKVTGDIFASAPGDDFRRHVTVSISEDAVVYGSVYSTDLVDLKATVAGSVTCAKFLLKTNSAMYENHLLDAVIDQGKRSDDFVSSLLNEEGSRIKSVVQWLD